MELYRALGRPVRAVQESTTQVTLANDSRIVTLPDSPSTVRGLSSVDLLVVDEAAMVSDETFVAVTPMLAASGGDMVCLSTPLGKRGWFFNEWTDGGADWHRIKVTVHDCPRISPAFIEEQRRILGPRWFRQEMEASFEEAIGQVWATDAVNAAFASEEAPLFGGSIAS